MVSSSLLRDYVKSGTLGGFPNAIDSSKHLFERLYWALVCASTVFTSLWLLSHTFRMHQQDRAVIVVDTDYASWTTEFPAVSICERDNYTKISRAAEKIYGPNRNLSIDLFVRDIAFFNGFCKTCESLCTDFLNCTADFNYITAVARKPCSELIENCTWNHLPFNCCDEFLPLKTEIGPCYTLNSVNSEKFFKISLVKLNFSLEWNAAPPSLKFSSPDDLYVYIHSPEDIPINHHPRTEKNNLHVRSDLNVDFSIRDISYDSSLTETTVEERECLFPNEKKLRTYRAYSFPGCIVDCRADAQIRLCNCTLHFIPTIRGINVCNIQGIQCLSKNAEALRQVDCNCEPPCNEPTYLVDTKKPRNVNSDNDESAVRRISINLLHVPRFRLKRLVISTDLGFTVSLGGMISLFVGGSILSTIELPYFLFIRRYQQRN